MTVPSISTAKAQPMRAGGRATEAGMAFQAAVAPWFGVHILVRLPVGGRFGINNLAVPTVIRLETGTGLDDIEVTQSDGGALHIQCKTAATLATGAKAPLTKTGGQLAEWLAEAKARDGALDLTRNAAVLAVRSDAARTLDDLEAGCRAFDLGSDWVLTLTQRNAAQRTALNALGTIVTAAWTTERGAAPTDDDLATMARSFHVARFAMEEGNTDWREASTLLGRHLFESDAAGDGPLRDLRAIMRDLISSGAPADREGLLRALRRRGHSDVGAPQFDKDVARLRALTNADLTRLAVHGQLPVAGGVSIIRESDMPLVGAIRSGSLLVVGEPGAGKTGALFHAAKSLADEGAFIVFLSVDRFPGVAIAKDLASELRLDHGLIETLSAIPGPEPKYLFIDALDAARGGPAEGVFASLIEQVRRELDGGWNVVASIRTFDLSNGRRYSRAFIGRPANDDYAEKALTNVRHSSVPRLTDTDLEAAGASAHEIATLLASATTTPLAELLRNVFNLSLAAELLSDGTDPAEFAGIRTQSGLIDIYEDRRMPTTGMVQAAAAAVAVMAECRRLTVRKVDVRHSDVDKVIQSGVLAATGDLVSFAHHVLFDHVAGRFHLSWDDPERLIAQLAGDTSAALLLAPALRFAVERVWRMDGPGRSQSWLLVCGIFSAPTVDAVLGNVALRIISENVGNIEDLTGLVTRLTAEPNADAIASLLGRLSRVVAMDINAARGVRSKRAIAWATLAEKLANSRQLTLVDPARVLLQTLFEHADLANEALLTIFGRAARCMLEFAWAQSPPLLATSNSAIRFVGRSYASDIAASRTLLGQILLEPHFSQFADREAHWLAEQILSIATADPSFAAEIYAALYGQMITDTAISHLGGYRSRIMPLSSNRRQDYEQSLWYLGKSVEKFLAISPEYGTRAVIDAVIGKAQKKGYGARDQPTVVDLGTSKIELRGFDVEFNAWEEQEDDPRQEDDPLARYVAFLRICDLSAFAESVAAASRDYATASVWTRILGVASERVVEVGDLIWPLMSRTDFFENGNTMRDAIRFAAAAWPFRSCDDRKRFETMMHDHTGHLGDDAIERWQTILGRILAIVPEGVLVLETTRELRRKLQAENRLEENVPFRRSFSSSISHYDHVRAELRQAGVNMDSGPNRIVLNASDALQTSINATPSESQATKLAALWSEAIRLLGLVDANPDLHEQVSHAAWGHISNAVERVASGSDFIPGTDGLPDLEAVMN